jgi:hypothetical protein
MLILDLKVAKYIQPRGMHWGFRTRVNIFVIGNCKRDMKFNEICYFEPACGTKFLCVHSHFHTGHRDG